MQQIRHLMYACLIIVVLSAGVFLITKISSTKFASETSSVVIDTDTSEEYVGISKGKKIFQQNCQSCHILDKDLTGPALRNFTSRGPWTDRENIYKWIKNPAAFMKNDRYTQELSEYFGGVTMVGFPDLTKEDIDAIIEYTNQKPSESINTTVALR